MRMRNAVLFAFTGLVVAACDTNDEAETDPGLLPADEPAVEQEQEDVALARGDFSAMPDAGELNVTGWVELHQRDGLVQDGLELRVHLMGLSEGDHAWHVHRGTCDAPGEVVLPLSDSGDLDGIAGDLNAGSDGMVEETVGIDDDHVSRLNLSENHVVAVHLRGGDDPGPPIACAPLTMAGAAGTAGTTGY
jgi:hypothetical protein